MLISLVYKSRYFLNSLYIILETYRICGIFTTPRLHVVISTNVHERLTNVFTADVIPMRSTLHTALALVQCSSCIFLCPCSFDFPTSVFAVVCSLHWTPHNTKVLTYYITKMSGKLCIYLIKYQTLWPFILDII